MKRTALTNALLIAGLSVGMIACGGDSSSSSNSNNTGGSTSTGSSSSTDEVLNFTIIDDTYNNATRSEFAERSDYQLRDGQSTLTTSVIKGSAEGHNEDTSNGVSLAPNFYATEPASDQKFNDTLGKTVDVISVDDREFSYYISSANGQKLVTTLQQVSLDISGVTADDKEKFDTPLDDFALTNSKFPEGSLCYAYSKFKPSFTHFFFYDDNASSYESLAAFVEKEKAHHNDFIAEHYVNVGDNNEYQAVYLETTTGKQTTGGYSGAVMYNGKVYSADYELADGYFPNTTVAKGAVECDILNDVAADYLAEEIKLYGKLDSF